MIAGLNVSGTSAAGVWTQISGTYTVPAGVAWVRMRPGITANATAGQVWMDDADGIFLLVTIAQYDVPASIETLTGISLPINVVQLPAHADVFLSDVDANVLDADGDPANGMTPLVRVENCDDFATALAAAGYTLVP